MLLAFFDKRRAQSRTKAAIIAKYFSAWAKIVGAKADKLVYVDLFAGPGRYKDGSPSTPLLILQHAIGEPRLRSILVSMFNDENAAFAEQLKREIAQLSNVQQLRHKPAVYDGVVDAEMAELFRGTDLAPTFAFIDPWGYKGISRKLIRALIRNWGGECAFFFNYNRISMGLTNPKVEKHMQAIFGEEWLDTLRVTVAANPRKREPEILKAFKLGLRQPLAQQLGFAIAVDGVGRVALGVGRALGAVEDVVGREVHEHRPQCLAGAREVLDGGGVEGEGGIGLVLRAVDVVVGGGVDDVRRPQLAQQVAHARGVEDVEIGPRERHDVTRQVEGTAEVGAELARRPEQHTPYRGLAHGLTACHTGVAPLRRRPSPGVSLGPAAPVAQLDRAPDF